MTDIQRHLPKIIKAIRAEMQAEAPPDEAPAALEQRIFRALRELLPASYGIGAGTVTNGRGQRSQPLELLVYDTTRAGEYPVPDEQGAYPLHTVLLALDAQHTHEDASLRAALARLGSIKALANAPAGKERAPLTALCFSRYVGASPENSGSLPATAGESLWLALHAALHSVPPAQRPDSLFALAHGLAYQRALPDGTPLDDDAWGLYREPALGRPRTCYICKEKFFRQHFFYAQLCQRCGDFNYTKRRQTADLRGRIALVTGARVKIGYAVALRLLRAGAQVIATTRFPHDAARRYAQEPDFAAWSHRLHLYGLDLRHLPGVEEFIRLLEQTYPTLDILINNAAQTVRRPPAFYAHLLPFEMLELRELPPELRPLLQPQMALEPAAVPAIAPAQEAAGALPALLLPDPQAATRLRPAELSQLALLPGDEVRDPALFPPGELDEHGQQVDQRGSNSWTLRLEEVAMPEVLEVHLINAVAPAVLVGQLKALMRRGEQRGKYIINVSAMEGHFRQEKRPHHPHTNMAKAALNMLTHSSASDYAAAGIYMNSVDPGWVSQQAPLATAALRADLLNHQVPLDEEDAAARICDPIFTALATGQPEYGKFFKDYKESPA
jgi:NAD(P)-dependent dehydrogenase (short-subunit alcohol dehydrogenase family)